MIRARFNAKPKTERQEIDWRLPEGWVFADEYVTVRQNGTLDSKPFTIREKNLEREMNRILGSDDYAERLRRFSMTLDPKLESYRVFNSVRLIPRFKKEELEKKRRSGIESTEIHYVYGSKDGFYLSPLYERVLGFSISRRIKPLDAFAAIFEGIKDSKKNPGRRERKEFPFDPPPGWEWVDHRINFLFVLGDQNNYSLGWSTDSKFVLRIKEHLIRVSSDVIAYYQNPNFDEEIFRYDPKRIQLGFFLHSLARGVTPVTKDEEVPAVWRYVLDDGNPKNLEKKPVIFISRQMRPRSLFREIIDSYDPPEKANKNSGSKEGPFPLDPPPGWEWDTGLVYAYFSDDYTFGTGNFLGSFEASRFEEKIKEYLRLAKIQDSTRNFYSGHPGLADKFLSYDPNRLSLVIDEGKLYKSGLPPGYSMYLGFVYRIHNSDYRVPLIYFNRPIRRLDLLGEIVNSYEKTKKNPGSDLSDYLEPIQEAAGKAAKSGLLRPRKYGRSYSMKAVREQIPEMRAALRDRDARRFGKAWIKAGLQGSSDAIFDGIISGAIVIPALAGAGLFGAGGGAGGGAAAGPIGAGAAGISTALVGGAAAGKAGYELVKPMLLNPAGPTPRRKVRSNPYGTPTEKGISLVRVGNGTQVHIFDQGTHLCKSGKNAGSVGGSGAKPVSRPATDAHFVTCYRCSKLAQLNRIRYGSMLPPRE